MLDAEVAAAWCAAEDPASHCCCARSVYAWECGRVQRGFLPARAQGTFAGAADKTPLGNDQDEEIDRFDRVTTTGGAIADQP